MIRELFVASTVLVALGTGPAFAQDRPGDPPAAEPSPAAPAEPLTAEDVLAKMAEAYKTCESYQDTGEVRIDFDTKQGKWTDIRPFKTAFVSPGKLRYEFTSRPGARATGRKTRYVVWADGTMFRSWWSIGPQSGEHPSIGMALAGPTGVSGGSAILIPSMLFPQEMSGLLTHLSRPTIVAEEKVDGADCYKIDAEDVTGVTITLWVEKEQFLVRKVLEKRKIEDFTTEQTTTYKPKINAPVEDEQFAFDPKNEE